MLDSVESVLIRSFEMVQFLSCWLKLQRHLKVPEILIKLFQLLAYFKEDSLWEPTSLINLGTIFLPKLLYLRNQSIGNLLWKE